MSKIILILFSSLFLWSPLVDANEQGGDEPKVEEKATIHFIRIKEAVGHRGVFNFESDQGHTMRMRHRSTHQLEVDPGTVTLTLRTFGARNDQMSMEVEPGKEYFVLATTRTGGWADRGLMVEVTSRFFEREKARILMENPTAQIK